MNDRARIDKLLDDRTAITAERDRFRDIAYRLAADVAVLKGVSPYVVALGAGLLPQVSDLPPVRPLGPPAPVPGVPGPARTGEAL